MTVKISFSQALDLAQMAVADKGEDYVYQRPFYAPLGHTVCAYYDESGQPSCLVGHILHGMGLRTRGRKNFCSVAELAEIGVISIDAKTNYFLGFLQSSQDIGIPWGTALAQALAHYKTFADEAGEESNEERVEIVAV